MLILIVVIIKSFLSPNNIIYVLTVYIIFLIYIFYSFIKTLKDVHNVTKIKLRIIIKLLW